MTDRLSDEQFEREVSGFLAWQAEAVADAPTANDMAVRVSSRAGTRTFAPRLAPQLVWVLLLGLLLVALAAASMFIGGLPPGPRLVSYEAVFLRLEVIDDAPEVLVVGVNPAGSERLIARLPGAWMAYDLRGVAGYLAPEGAVSRTGLLALPTNRGDANPRMLHWEVHDLNRPEAEPTVVPGHREDFELIGPTPYIKIDGRPIVFWGDAVVEGACRTQRLTGEAKVDWPHRDPFGCLAPDDSMSVAQLTNDPAATVQHPIAGLASPATRELLRIAGNFAGWIEVAQ
jgi:hypothetical protein